MNTPLQALIESLEKGSKCEKCEGNGYTSEHDSIHTHDPDTGACQNCPIQVQCEDCYATGIHGYPQLLEYLKLMPAMIEKVEMINRYYKEGQTNSLAYEVSNEILQPYYDLIK